MTVVPDLSASESEAFFLLAGICTLMALWMLVHLSFPKMRPNWFWEERSEGTQVSWLGYAAYSLAATFWAVAAFAAGFGYQPIVDWASWFIGAGFIIVVAAAIHDHARSR